MPLDALPVCPRTGQNHRQVACPLSKTLRGIVPRSRGRVEGLPLSTARREGIVNGVVDYCKLLRQKRLNL